MIVEDDLSVLEINRRFTERVEGYEVCGMATRIAEAKEMLEILKPDLLLLDIYFPEENGIDFLWYIRANHRDVDVILITAGKELAYVQEAIRGGAIDYIVKPILFDRFEDTLGRYLEYRRKTKQIENVESQRQVDSLLRTVNRPQQSPEDVGEAGDNDSVPKGIDPLTLQKVKANVKKHGKDGVTAEEMGRMIGASRTTARRYLEYLVSVGFIRADLTYGSVGRPERRYYSR